MFRVGARGNAASKTARTEFPQANKEHGPAPMVGQTTRLTEESEALLPHEVPWRERSCMGECEAGSLETLPLLRVIVPPGGRGNWASPSVARRRLFDTLLSAASEVHSLFRPRCTGSLVQCLLQQRCRRASAPWRDEEPGAVRTAWLCCAIYARAKAGLQSWRMFFADRRLHRLSSSGPFAR